ARRPNAVAPTIMSNVPIANCATWKKFATNGGGPEPSCASSSWHWIAGGKRKPPQKRPSSPPRPHHRNPGHHRNPHKMLHDSVAFSEKSPFFSVLVGGLLHLCGHRLVRCRGAVAGEPSFSGN